MQTLITSLDSLFDGLGRLAGAWVSHGWSWDRRFECVASTFAVTHAEEARGLVMGVLTEPWTSKTLHRAPSLIVGVAELTGGVRSDQAIYSTPEVDGVIAYGLWWPWGGEGSNISMRIGLAGPVSYDDMLRLREIFGAPDD